MGRVKWKICKFANIEEENINGRTFHDPMRSLSILKILVLPKLSVFSATPVKISTPLFNGIWQANSKVHLEKEI